MGPDLANDIENIGVQVPASAKRVRRTLPIAIGDRQHYWLGRIADAGQQRLKEVRVDVGRRAPLEAFQIGAADHRVEQRIAEPKAQQIGLIRDALDIETRAVGLVQVEDAVLVDVPAPLLPFSRRAVTEADIAVIETADGLERAVAKPFAVVRFQQWAGLGVEARRERHILVRSEHQIIRDRDMRA